MEIRLTKDKRFFEWMLIGISLGTVALFAQMGPFKTVALNLFFLPIVLSGYFLGRSTTGVLALLCVLVVTIVSMSAPNGFAGYDTPLVLGLAVTVWGAVLGLTAILVGTLCDTRAATVRELHHAYVGVVEVLTHYLQGGNPHVKSPSVRIAELSQTIAEELRLPQKQVDDVRVAALLHELGNVEVTTQVISRAFDSIESGPTKRTFLGTDLVQSLGSVLEGALPLLAEQDDAVRDCLNDQNSARSTEAPLGVRIIRIARAYDDVTCHAVGRPAELHAEALRQLRTDMFGGPDDDVIDALERVVRRTTHSAPTAPALT